MKKTSHKSERVNVEVQKELSQIISMEIKDPRISPMTVVTGVNVTKDLKYCKVFVSVLGDEESVMNTIEGLKSSGLYKERTCSESEFKKYSGAHICCR